MKKKGFIADSASDMYSFFAYIIVMLVFFLIFKFGVGTISQTIGSEMSAENTIDLALLTIARTPVIIDGKSMTIGDALTKIKKPDVYDLFSEKSAREFRTVSDDVFRGVFPDKLDKQGKPIYWWVGVFSSNEKPRQGLFRFGNPQDFFSKNNRFKEKYHFINLDDNLDKYFCQPEKYDSKHKFDNTFVRELLIPKKDNGPNDAYVKIVACIQQKYFEE